MSEERWLKILGLIGFAMICTILVLTSGASADEIEIEIDEIEIAEKDYIIEVVNNFQDDSGSWGDDFNLTVFFTAANNEAYQREKIRSDSIGYKLVIDNGTRWIDQYDVEVFTYETGAIYFRSDFHKNMTSDEFIGAFSPVVYANDLRNFQFSDGSWNLNISDSSMAIYGLTAIKEADEGVIDSGVNWLQDQKDGENLTWGTIENDSKAILALEGVGVDMENEISVLMEKQMVDGSFGGIKETSWALIALSTKPNKETMGTMERAVTWLRARNYDNLMDLAIAALAEQYFENAKVLNQDGTGGNGGFGTLERLYVLSVIVIGSYALAFWLFAKLDKDDILSGVRLDIYQYIDKHPGEYIANITKDLGLSSSSVVYHLSVLEGLDYIVSHKNGKYKRYYANRNGYSRYTNGNGYKQIMSALKNNTARRIVKFLIANPSSNQKTVSDSLNIHPSTVNWHAKRLKDAEIISKKRIGKEVLYSLNQDVQLKKVIRILES